MKVWVQETRCCQNKECYGETGPQHHISKYEYACILKQIFACKCLTFLRSEICWVEHETCSRPSLSSLFLVCTATHCEISQCVCVCVCVLSRFNPVWLFTALWTAAHQAPPSMGILQARILEWVAILSSRGSSPPSDWIHISCSSSIAILGISYFHLSFS